MLRLNKDKTDLEYLDPPPMLREDVLALKRFTVNDLFLSTWRCKW